MFSRERRISNAISKMIDKQYALANTSKGYDCMNSMLLFYESLGATFPDEFEGIKRTDYARHFIKDEVGTREVQSRFLRQVGQRVEWWELLPGDLLLYTEQGTGAAVAAIYLSNGDVVVASTMGVRVVSMDDMNKQYDGQYEVRRILNV